jgi:hypothetical protein
MNFTKVECEAIINFSTKLEKHHSSEWDYDGDDGNYHAWHILKNDETLWVFERLQQFFETKTGNTIIKPFEVIHLHNFKTGSRLKEHKDKSRFHNVGVCLNDDYIGGELVLYEPKYSIPKIIGEIYTFGGWRPHEVLKIESGERWTLIGFFREGDLKLKKSIV